MHENSLSEEDLVVWEQIRHDFRVAVEAAGRRGITPAQFRDLVYLACCEASYGEEKAEEAC